MSKPSSPQVHRLPATGRARNAKNAAAAQATIARFYAAFARLDGDAMQACYAANAQFDDEVFSLRGRSQVGGMWHMLCAATQAQGRDVWRLQTRDITPRSAHWEAHYRFSATGRLVHNRIDAEFECGPDGLILRHRDHFDFWRWTRQALGMSGLVLGWTPWLRAKVRAKAGTSLAAYLASSHVPQTAAPSTSARKA